MTLAPRWVAAGVDEAAVSVGYAASQKGIGYLFRLRPGGVTLDVEADGADVRAHVLLPAGAKVRSVRLDAADIAFREAPVDASAYVDFNAHVDGSARFDIQFQ